MRRAVERTLNGRLMYNKKLLCMEMADGSQSRLGAVGRTECDAAIRVLEEDLFFDALFMSFPAVALGEAYFNGYWTESEGHDLGDILTVFSLSSFNVDPHGPSQSVFMKVGISVHVSP